MKRISSINRKMIYIHLDRIIILGLLLVSLQGKQNPELEPDT